MEADPWNDLWSEPQVIIPSQLIEYPRGQPRKLVDTYASEALKYYPNCSLAIALQKLAHERQIRGIFFWNEHGQRATWCEDLKDERSWLTMKKRYQRTVQGYDMRNYLMLKRPITLLDIDGPSSQEYRRLTSHKSEDGWNLPQFHKRHLLNFPPEILRKILSHVFTVPKLEAIEPWIITSNWKSNLKDKSLQVTSMTAESMYIDCPGTKGLHRNKLLAINPILSFNGKPLMNYHWYHVPIITATPLRASSMFYEIGSKMLYENNNFSFRTPNIDMHCSPPTLTDEQTIICPPFRRPDDFDDNRAGQIQDGMVMIELQRPEAMLPGWIYYDPFLRFLHEIGTERAATIRHIRFIGTPIRHECGLRERRQGGCHRRCNECLAGSLRFYVPFLNKYCTGLETLTIQIIYDTFMSTLTVEKGWYPVYIADEPTTEEVMLPVLENELRELSELPRLRSVIIVDNDGTCPDFARPTVKWFADKRQSAMRHLRPARWTVVGPQLPSNDVYGDHSPGLVRLSSASPPLSEESDICSSRKSSISSGTVTCGFCHEDHHWTECFNLCDSCGKYGHFQATCPMVVHQRQDLTQRIRGQC